MSMIATKKLLVWVALLGVLLLTVTACGGEEGNVDYEQVAVAVALTQTASAEDVSVPPTVAATSVPSTVAPTSTSEPTPASVTQLYPEMHGVDWGYVDANGTWAIEPQFQWAGDFSEGLAPANLSNGWGGYIDRSGNFVIGPQFRSMREFSEGLAFVWDDGRSGYIDSTGQMVIESTFTYVGDFSEGLANVNVDGLWGYIDQTGQMVIEPRFNSAGSFSGGLANVYMNDLWGYIDQTGQFVIELQFNSANGFSDGLALVFFDGLYGYIDQTGTVVIEPQFQWASDFSEGLAWIQVADSFNYGYIDTMGRIVIEPKFDVAEDFSGGLARVRMGDVVAYIDTTGQVVFEIAPFTFSETIDLTPEQVSFAYETLAGAVHGEVIPVAPTEIDGPGWMSYPAHLQFTLDVNTEGLMWDPILLIYPAQDHRAIYNRLRTLLTDRPQSVMGEIPRLPLANAAQVFKAQVAYLDFPGGSGVRFITRYAQDVSPITNMDLVYLFQGLTDDGKYYVSFSYPITTPSLPASFEDTVAADNYEAFAETYDTYISETVPALDALGTADYIPDLALLDAMMQSLQISY